MDDSVLHDQLRQLVAKHGMIPAQQPMTIHITCKPCARKQGRISARGQAYVPASASSPPEPSG